MSSISKNGSLWWYFAYRPDGSRLKLSISRYAGYKVKSRADARALQLQLDEKYSLHEPGVVRRITYEAFEIRFLDYAKTHKAPGSVVNDEYVLRIFRNFWRGKYVNELSLDIIDAFLVDLGIRKRTLWTKHGLVSTNNVISKFGRAMVHRSLRSIFNKAVEWEYLKVNPFAVRQILRVPKTITKSISESDLAKIFGVLRKTYPAHVDLYLTYLLTGARRQELLDATWKNFDWDAGVLTVHGKGDKERTIPLLPVTSKLIRHRQTLKTPGPFWGVSASWVSHMFHRACKLAGLNYKLHDLRKTYGTILAKSGVPVPVIQGIMGHEDERTTREAYLDLQIHGQLPNMEALNQLVTSLAIGKTDPQRN